MDFVALTRPEAFWALLALPVIYLLALPPRPRRVLVTAHMTTWQRALQRAGRRPVRMRRLRFWLLVAAFLAGVTAWSGPRFSAEPGPTELVVVVDRSASLLARGDDATQTWRRVRDHVRGGLDRVPSHVDVRVVLATKEHVRLLRGTAARTLAHAGVPAGTDADLAAVAAELATPQRRVWVVSDRPVTDGVTGVDWSALGAGGGNVSIDAVSLHDGWPFRSLRVEVEVHNHGADPTSVQLRSTSEVVAPFLSESLTVKGQERRAVAFELERSGPGGDLAIELISGVPGSDRIPEDDRAGWRGLPALPTREIAVLADEESDGLLRRAAEVLAAEVGGRVVPESGTAGFLLVEGGQVALEGLPPRGIYFGTRLSEDPVRPILDPIVLSWDRAVPLTVGVDLSDLRVRRAWTGVVPDDAKPVVTGAEGPLLAVRRVGDASGVHAAFRLSDSNLPLLAAFPQLLRRAYAISWGAAEPPEKLGPEAPPLAERAPQAAPPGAIGVQPLPSWDFGEPEEPFGLWFLAAAGVLLAIRVYA